jgi:hypothetical protein
MADIVETEKLDKTPLLKEKKPRPPQSQKQMENFKIMQEKRVKNAEGRKQEKILQAQRALLEKEGYVKVPLKVKEPIQFEIEEEEEEEEPIKPIKPVKANVKEIQPPPIATPKRKQVKKVKMPEPEPETETDGDSDSSEEIIVIKRKSKKKGVQRRRSVPLEEDDEDEYIGGSNAMGFFC